MAAIKRKLSRFRGGGDEPESLDGNTDETAPDEFETVIDGSDLDEFDEIGGGEYARENEYDETELDDGPGRPYVWIGLAVGSVAGLGASVYKLYQHRKEVKATEEAARDEPWRVEEEAERLPDDAGTASLVGLVFLAVLNALGKRLERDHWE